MALDGITIAALVNELKNTLVNGRITKIAQPEKDELLLTIKQSINNGGGSTMRFQKRLTASVNPSLPLLYLNDENKQSPMSAPTFCMVLRKHLNNCRITEINQAGLERVIRIELEHLNEMGDLCRKFLIIELMGKHSNIIFCDENMSAVDNAKRFFEKYSKLKRTFEEAARLAAYYSKAKEQGKAEIDYIQKKHVKKPNGSKPGFVVYYTNYSMTIDTDISGIKEVLE